MAFRAFSVIFSRCSSWVSFSSQPSHNLRTVKLRPTFQLRLSLIRNSPISPDGKYFFWGSTRELANYPLVKRHNYRELMEKLRGPGNGLGDIYQIDIAELKIKK
jgi:hypothetical protein